MKTKITGMVTILTPKKIRISSNRRHIWEIKRTPKPKVISGTLRRGSTVTLEFNKADGKDLGGPQPGRRTETGTVIKLTGTQIRVDNTTPDPKTWTINRTASTTTDFGTLAVGSVAQISADDPPDWTHIA